MVNIKTIDAKVLSRMFLAGAKNLEQKKNGSMNKCISCSRWRYRYKYDYDDHVCSCRSKCADRTGYGNAGKSHFLPVLFVVPVETLV